MRQLEVPVATILPVQHPGVWRSGVDMYIADAGRGKAWPAVDVIAHPDMPEHHILLHGHHRGRAAYELGRATIMANLTETDADLQSDEWNELRWFYPGLKTVQMVLERYRDRWQPQVAARGFSGLHDMPFMSETKQEERKPPPGMSFQEYAKWERGY